MKIKKQDYDVIQDTVNDFDYFYEEEKDYKRNRKVIFKYKLLTIIVLTIISIFLLTSIGVVRMKMLGTDNIITRDELNRLDFLETTDGMNEFASFVYESYIPKLEEEAKKPNMRDVNSLSASMFSITGYHLCLVYENKEDSKTNMYDELEKRINVMQDIEVPSDNSNSGRYYMPYTIAITQLLQYEKSFIIKYKDGYVGSEDFEFDDPEIISIKEAIKSKIQEVINLKRLMENPDEVVEEVKNDNEGEVVALANRNGGVRYVFY